MNREQRSAAAQAGNSTSTYVRKLACLALAILLCAVAGCRAPEPDQLVWLSPASPCQPGDVGFGSESCFVRRKQDAVAVLKLPAKYGQANNGSASGGFSAEDVVFTPTEVLTSRKSGKAWVAEIKKIREHKQTAGPGRSFLMQSVSWGWRTQTYPEGHATAMRQIASEARSPHYGSSAAFVAIESPAADFEVHARKACVDFMPRVSSSRGQISPRHPCQASPHFYLARQDERAFAVCGAPIQYDDKVTPAAYCRMFSHFKLRDVDGSPFIVVYTYLAPREELTSGQWKYVHARFEAWIRSMDVTVSELERVKQ